jgi:glycosyltransferase involved in cell wall biosynthesis
MMATRTEAGRFWSTESPLPNAPGLTEPKAADLPLVLMAVEPLGMGVLYSISRLCWALHGSFRIHVLHGVRSQTPSDYRKNFPPETDFTDWRICREISPLRDAKAAAQLRSVVRGLEPDIIHAHSSKAGALVRLCFPAPTFPVFYSPRGYSFLRRDTRSAMRAAFFGMEWLLGRTRHITVAAGDSEHEVAKSVARNVRVIRNMIDLSDLSVCKETRPMAPPLCAVMSGANRPQKNFPLFLEIARGLTDQPINFVWVGEPLTGHEWTPNVEVTGWLAREQALARIAAGHVFVQTSLWEGLPIALLEGLALELPVLATPVVGNADLVMHGRNGYYCRTAAEFADRLRELLANPALRERLGRESRSIVETHYTVASLAESWVELYTAALDGEPKHARSPGP